MSEIKYPIGRFIPDGESTPEKRSAWIRDIAELPARVRRATDGLSPAQQDTPYREAGWTVRQVVHHIADSHMNAFARFKLALTETNPQIKPYNQDAWATTADVLGADIALSLSLIDGLHGRWAALLSALAPAEFTRTFLHPERGLMTLDHTLQMYAWHGRHHVAQIAELRTGKGW
jgi:uncharacterized damage-inducible protein DinB